MTKSLVVDPTEVRKPSVLKAPEIPVCQYKASFADERKRFSDADLIGVYEDMVLVREFETMLQKIKMEGAYEGVSYDHMGPAHLSIGQEASAVGQALTLGVEDLILGSHRSHGEILAKGMSAIRKLSDDDLMKVMSTFDNGAILKVVEADFSGGSVKDLARAFLVYGTMAEIFARETGFNKGLGGSMHAFFTPFGVYPNNAIVGGSADIAAGVALFKKVNQKPGLVIANIGDASAGCGPVWEAIAFATMDQYRSLWDDAHKGGLPLIFNFMNNFYGMGGQTVGETMGYGMVARLGLAANPEGMHAERVDGYNPLAVADAISRKRKVLEEGRGPVLLETMTYRYSGHSPSDASSYRTKEEVELWQQQDSIVAYGETLAKAKLLAAKGQESFQSSTVSLLKAVLVKAIDDSVSPRIHPERIGELMFSNTTVEKFEERTPDLDDVSENNPRLAQLSKKVRTRVSPDGKPVPKARQYNVTDAIFEAMLHRYQIDPTMVAYGEENRDWGGAFACYRGLTEALPYHRLFNSPISEAAIVGSAVGYALAGGRVVCELMYCDFLGRAGDEVFNQMAKWQSMSAGVLKMPVVLRVSVGNKYGAQHSQDWTAMCNHIPGLKVAFPATPYDAKGMLNAALAGTDPVVFFESQRLYGMDERFVDEVPAGYYEVPVGQPAKRREGKDLTIITVGAVLYRALEAAEQLSQKYGIEAEVWDARWINPLDYTELVASAKRTGRVLLSCDAVERGSVIQGMASTIQAAAFGHLDAPVAVVGSRNWICPGPELEADYFPQADWILDAVHEQLLPLPGHQARTNQSIAERLRRSAKGV
ncbi:MAG: dehydrogenase [Planctomycetota bacterium]|nr:MAG: dehydrogenase [Planctomycetota bacterium]